MSSLWLHHSLMADRVRLRALEKAIREVVRPGAVAVDLGAGTGILGFMALNAGAARVYAIDPDPILKVARALAAENALEDRIRFIPKDSLRVKLPERADVVIADFVGRLGMDGEILDALIDARRFLKPGGRFLPERSEVWVAPVSAPAFYRFHALAGGSRGFRMDSLHALTTNRIGFPGKSVRGVLSPFQRVAEFRFPRSRPVYPQKARVEFRVKAGTVHGLLTNVRVQFSPKVHSNGRFGAHWSPAFLPIHPPLQVREGRRISASVNLHAVAGVEWSVEDRYHSNLFEFYVDKR